MLVKAAKLELDPDDPPFPDCLLGQRAIKCSVLSQIRHFMISPLRSLGLPCRPKPFPVEPFRSPFPLDDRKVRTGSANQNPFPRLCREHDPPRPPPLPLDRLKVRLQRRTGRPVKRLQLRLAFRYW